MQSRLHSYILTLFLFLKAAAPAQNEASKWYFGNQAGLDFMTSPPTVLTNGNMATWEGCSSLADASGNLLLYTNGLVVLNRLNQIMANGSGLAGDMSSTQSALIIKQPGHPNICYIFTTHAGESSQHSLNYSIADMSLAAGNGSITAKNIQLYAHSAERLCAVKHCNGVDFWIITQDLISADFRNYLLTASGISSVVTCSTSITYNEAGYLKASPSGRKLGMATYTDPSNTFAFAILDFDNATGIVSNAINLGSNIKAYGCEFSPDETKFYASTCDNFLFQWDLCAGSGNGNAIAASQYSVNIPDDPSHFQPLVLDSIMGALQLAPDGKIYLARGGEKKLGVINNPNAAGSACNFADTSLSIFPKLSYIGLPNFMPLFKPALPPFSTTLNTAISCNTASFTVASVANCPFSNYIDHVLWDFGDPGSGSANNSTLTVVTHTYANAGVYPVKLVFFNHCGIPLDTLQQQFSVLHVPVSSASGFTLCSGNSLTLAASGFSNYSWSTGSTASSIQVSPSVNTSYTVTATDAYGCHYASVQTITVSPAPPVAIAGNSISCGGAAVTQTASGGITYHWSSGETTTVVSLAPNVSTTYTVTGTDVKGCTGTATASIRVVTVPSLAVNNATACNDATVTLYATADNPVPLTYSWAPGTSSSSSITVAATATQEYTVTAATDGCTTSATGLLTVISPDLTLSPSMTIVPGNSVTLQASGGESFSWSPPDFLNCATCSNPVASPTTDINYCVTVLQNSCSATACLTIAVSCDLAGDLSLPNAFTPNGDNNNDEFCLRGWECTSDFTIRIFDRWGENVFTSSDPAFCWDGIYKGKLLDAAIFVYVVSAKKRNNEAFTKKGTITLIH